MGSRYVIRNGCVRHNCRRCSTPLARGDTVVSKHVATGRSYYCVGCASRVGIWF